MRRMHRRRFGVRVVAVGIVRSLLVGLVGLVAVRAGFGLLIGGRSSGQLPVALEQRRLAA